MKFDEDDPDLLDSFDFLALLRQDIAYFEGVADTAEHEGMAERLRGDAHQPGGVRGVDRDTDREGR